LRSLLGVSIVANDRHIGVVWVGNRTVRNWDGRAVSLSSIFSNQLSQTLARAELFRSEQARRRVADTLRETAQIFTTLRPFNDILELIFDQLGHVLPYDSASVMLREDNELHIVGGRGFTPETQTVIKNLRFTVNEDPHLEQVMTTRQPLVLDDAQASPYFVPAAGTEHIRGWIAAPILADDEVVGLVTVDSHEIGAYDADDAQLVFALASQAAQAIRNAYQYEQITSLNADLERRVAERTAELEDEQDRLRAVHAITLELTATLELELTLNKALELAARAVGAQRGSIMLREADGDALTCRAVLNPDGEVVTTSIPISFADGGGLSGWIINARSAVCIADVRTDTRWLREEGRADEVRSVIAAPLMTQDGPLGVLMLSSPHEAFFGDAQLQLLTTIGNEIAIVIHNAALYKVISELAYDRGISEAQQREENSKNQAILQSLGEGVMVFDEQQQVVLFNPAAEQMLGIPASALAGQSLKNVRTQATAGGDTTRAEHVYTGLNDGLRLLDEQGRNHNRMLELSAPSQTIALNFAPWVGPRGAVYGSVVVMRDVTREIESDRAKREFISSVSHELRTPLTSIKGYVDLLMLGSAGQLSENQTAFLSVVKNNANRLMDLINDILEIGRIDSDKIVLNFDEVDIANMFADVLQTLRVQIDRKSMRVRAEVAERLPVITADSKRITQVVLNLVSNAIKYTYAEGQILLRADLNPAGMVQIDVKDNGVGISQEDQKNLFRRFQRFDNPLRDEAGGTGLGLSIAKSLVELHGGEMWVESEPGEGSTFSFVIPVSQPDPGHEIDSE
jgi:signal transduction histidine kinase/GAF domain-containing protein